MKWYTTIVWPKFWSRDHVVNWKHYVTTFAKVTITKPGWNRYENKKVPCLYVTWFIINHLLYLYMSFVYVIFIKWSCNLLKLHSVPFTKTITTNSGGNTHQNEMVVYLHVTWSNHAKVIKALTPNIALMKGTYLNRPWDLRLHDILTNEKRMW